jgi:hypothetical protein
LGERDSHFPPLPADLHKHIVLAGIFNGHVPDLDDLAPRSGETVFTATHLARVRDARPVLDSVRQTAHGVCRNDPTRLTFPSTAISAISP